MTKKEQSGSTILNQLANSQPEVLLHWIAQSTMDSNRLLSAMNQAGWSNRKMAEWAYEHGYDPDASVLSPYWGEVK